MEVDFILGDMKLALEVKASQHVHSRDGKGINALQQDQKVARSVIISFEKEPKVLNGNIECFYWEDFLTMLWNGDFEL